MKKNGFTLVELLAVLAVLALLLTIAVPGIQKMSYKIQNNMFCDKVEHILKGAQLYGDDNYDAIKSKSGQKDIIKVKDLVKHGYVKKDNNKEEDENMYVVDSRDDTSMMNEEITLYIKNNRVYATYNFREDDKEICK